MAKSYESEITHFLKNLKELNPELEKKQLEGRSRLWDRQLDAQLLEDFRLAAVPQKPYVYQTN